MDLTTFFGLVIGIGGILLGNTIEGGHLTALVQGASAVIVLLGTVGATVVSSSSTDLKLGLQLLLRAFREDSNRASQKALRDLIEMARTVKKEDSILAIS